MPQHAIPEIAQIGCTGAEIGIAGAVIRCDFRIDRSVPRKRRRCKVIVFEERDLERENCFRVSVPCFAREHGESQLGRRECIEQGLTLLRRRSMLTGIVLYGSQTHERSQRNSGGGGPPLDAMRSSMRSIVHPENLHRQASQALPVQPSHQFPPRENKWSNLSAPSSPSP